MPSGILNSGKFFGNIPRKTISIAIVIAGIAGILLILLSDLFHSSGQDQNASSNSQNISSNYETVTAQRLEDIIGRISGVGRVKVMVTVESGVENIYETDNKETTNKSQNGSDSNTQIQQSNETSHVIVNGGSGNQQALLTKQIQPQILGVVVVCDGGSNPDVQEAVTNTVSIALGIATNRISVNKMETQTR